MEEYNTQHPRFDFKSQAYQEALFKDEMRHHDHTATPIQGRMSPAAKQRLYESYQQGATIKDLSLKYGIFPERVKAIIYQKHLYWEEVYPRLGETHMRLAWEREFMYAAQFPFVDYGIDLHDMAEQEKGIRVARLT